MYLRTTSRTNADGTKVEYYQLAHNVPIRVDALPIDGEGVRALTAAHPDLFAVDEAMFEREHSLEVELPFCFLGQAEHDPNSGVALICFSVAFARACLPFLLAELPDRAELAESLRSEHLAQALDIAPVAWAQRLGYLLEMVGAVELAEALFKVVEGAHHEWTRLAPWLPKRGEYNARWRVVANETVEPDV